MDQRGYRMFRLVCCAIAVAVLGGVATPRARVAPADARLIEHVLNRLGYGPRPGDIDRVGRIGVQAWVAAQLRPDRLDDRGMDTRLEALETLGLDTTTIFRNYYRPAIEERRRRQREEPQPDAAAMTTERTETTRERRPGAPSDAMARNRQVLAELEEARILRAVYSEHQLEEALVDFWFNHFNVFAAKGPTRAFVTSYERDVIRPHVLGSFREMLEAVASSPAMLFYLDNWLSTRETTPRALNPRASNPRASNPRGLNENYARELLELHTLGVDGGYTQDDVENVARAFTGWTFVPRQGTGFHFAPQMHDQGEKVVLGHRIKAGGGIDDGRKVLDILASHPATARFIATKLAVKFVSDAPPPALVERAARTFRETGGNLREVTRVILTSPEFLAPEAYRAKVKTPLEFVASALRSTGADIQTAQPIVRTLRELGMPLYLCQPPTGYYEAGDTWVSSGALVARMNFALALGANRLKGVSVAGLTEENLTTVRRQILAQALPGGASDSTLATVDKGSTAAQVIGLVIGSPEFQKQ
jgi:uncharacterized protein (DUF1800 family)